MLSSHHFSAYFFGLCAEGQLLLSWRPSINCRCYHPKPFQSRYSRVRRASEKKRLTARFLLECPPGGIQKLKVGRFLLSFREISCFHHGTRSSHHVMRSTPIYPSTHSMEPTSWKVQCGKFHCIQYSPQAVPLQK